MSERHFFQSSQLQRCVLAAWSCFFGLPAAVFGQGTLGQPAQPLPSPSPAPPTSPDLLNYFPANSVSATPSYYGATGPSATSSIGTPGFIGETRQALASLLENPLRWGPFTAHPHMSYGFTYATGVLITPGEGTDTALHTVAPGLSVVSRHLTLDYTPTLSYYSKGPYTDTVNHNASLRSVFGYGDWVFAISQAYQKAASPTIETGRQTKTEGHATSVDASWNYSEKVFFNFSLNQQIQSAEDFQNYKQWSTMDWVNYRLMRNLSIGAGVGGGYAAVDLGSDMTYEQIQGRINWSPGTKFSINLNGGIEIRQFVDVPDSDNLVNPLLGAAIIYRVLEKTSVSLYANSSVNNSLFENQVIETTTIGGGVSQRLVKHLNASLSAGYRSSDYKLSPVFNQNFRTPRSEKYTFVATGLSTTFLRKGSVSIGYQHGINDSNIEGFNFESDQFSFQVGYQF